MLSLLLCLMVSTVASAEPMALCEIHVVDDATSRGIPLVELVTVDKIRHVTDSAGRVAYPALPGKVETVFFAVHPQGYQVPKDGFGSEGVKLNIVAGEVREVRLKRINIAERLYRCTGRDIYRDSLLLGYEVPLPNPDGTGRVVGQDSVQVAKYRNKLYWFWGDTNRLEYPLGLFRTAGATSLLPHSKTPTDSEPTESMSLTQDRGVDYQYFVGDNGFVRAMVDVTNPKGVVWIDGVVTVTGDEKDGKQQQLIAHFSRRNGLAEEYEHGILRYSDAREIFEVAATLPLKEKWRFPQNHPLKAIDGEAEYLYFGTPYPVTRVPATSAAVHDPTQYQSWTCLDPASSSDNPKPLRDENKQLDWQWRVAPPVTPKIEQEWLKRGLLSQEEAYYLPRDVLSERPIQLHSGSVYWNEYRQQYVMIAVEHTFDRASPSMLGEVYYTESKYPQGPYTDAIKILTHDKQSFYNPCWHPFFSEDGGRMIYFEGTYTNSFTNSPPTPRYDYNQMMYRLDLNHESLREHFPR